MKTKLALTLTALTVGLLGATANAQYAPARPGVRPNVVDKRRPIVRQPAFNAFPTTAVRGKLVTITGRWLPANAVLYIGNKRIAARHATGRKLTFKVPAQLALGKHSAYLRWPGHKQFIGWMTVETPYRAPVVNGIAATALVGNSLTITGRWLPANAVLKLGGYTLRPTYASPTRLTFKIPVHMATRRYAARLMMGRMVKNLGWIRLVAPKPVITSVPNRAVLGKNLVIYGRHLPANAILKIGNKLLKATWASPTKLTFKVPHRMATGTRSLKLLMATGNKRLGRIYVSAPYYKPVVRYAPRSATTGKYITITGSHLPANALLKVGGYTLRARSASATRLVFKVPTRLRSSYYAMSLATSRETLSLGRIRIHKPRRHFWSFYVDWNGFLALR